jgi:hypothetical protein
MAMECLARWGTAKHYDGMRDLTHRLKGYLLEKLLTAMMALDQGATLDLAAKLFVDADKRAVARSVLSQQNEAAEPVLIPLARHESADVRYAAAQLLAVSGSQAALTPLRDQLAEEQDRTAKATIDFAIRQIARRTQTSSN